MNKTFTILAVVIIASSSAFSREIYVAKNGDDNNPGTLDEPYLTLLKGSTQAFPGDTILIREGLYGETLQLPRSGTAGNPITIMAYGDEKVVISAMEPLSGWTIDAGSVYRTSVNWDLGQQNFVMFGDTACDLARWPNNTDGNLFTLNSLRNSGGSGGEVITNAYLDYATGIPAWDWGNGGSVFFYCDKGGAGWTSWKSFIKTSSGTRVTFDLDKNPTWIRTVHPPGDLGDFYLEGIREALDYPHEWYFDNGTLYIQLPGGAQPADSVVYMRKRLNAINLDRVDYIVVKNLSVYGGSINITGSHNKMYAVTSRWGNHHRGVVTGFSSNSKSLNITGSYNSIEKCEIGYGAGTGVWVSGTGNRIENSYIHDFNYLGNYDAPLMVRNGTSTTIIHNTVTRGGRDCIQGFNRNSLFAYNDVSHSNLIADDCGLFYTVGGPYNISIHHNWFHDAHSRGGLYKAAGIYLDNNAEDFNVHHNVVWNTEWASIQMNLDCKDIDVFNNTFWDASGAMGAWHKEGTQFTNIKVYNNLADNSAWEPQSDKQNNLSVTVDPFVNMADKNFQLKPGSQPIDYGRVITGITDGYTGNSPDAGAYEFGGENWVAGIDWDPVLGPTVCLEGDVYEEVDGYVVIEAESASGIGQGWNIADSVESLGTGYLVYDGPDETGMAIDSTISTYSIKIGNPGTYRFQWLARNGSSAGSEDEENSSWLSIACDNFYGILNGETTAFDTSFVNVWTNSLDAWSWNNYGESGENDSLELYAKFSGKGIYTLRIAGRSSGHTIDRIALYQEGRHVFVQDPAQAESPTGCDEYTVPSPWSTSKQYKTTYLSPDLVIDGKIDEDWQYVEENTGAYPLPGGDLPADQDLSFTFRVAYNDSALFLLAMVRDEILSAYPGTGEDYEQWDNLELFLNPGNDHQALGLYGEHAIHLRMNYGRDHQVSIGNGTWKNAGFDGFELITADTTDGYILEARIPWSGILPEGSEPLPGSLLGFEIQVNDRDGGPGIDNRVAWANNTGIDFSLYDTRKFGNMSLKDPSYKYINKSEWEVIYVDSEEAKGVKDRAIDGDPGSYWITVWRGTPASLPHEIQIDFKRALDVAQVHYLNRQDDFGPDGAIGEYEVYLSDSLNDWGEPAAKGEIQWTQELVDHYNELQIINIDPVKRGRYLKLLAITEAQENPAIPYTAVAELDIVTGELPLNTDAHEALTGDFKLYPNPATGNKVRILLPDHAERIAVYLFSIQGRLISHDQFRNTREFEFGLDQGIPEGLYIIKLAADGKTSVGKLIID